MKIAGYWIKEVSLSLIFKILQLREYLMVKLSLHLYLLSKLSSNEKNIIPPDCGSPVCWL